MASKGEPLEIRQSFFSFLAEVKQNNVAMHWVEQLVSLNMPQFTVHILLTLKNLKGRMPRRKNEDNIF
jgi:hypothetical protein